MSKIFKSIGKFLGGGQDPRAQYASYVQDSAARTQALQERAQQAAADTANIQGMARISEVLNSLKSEPAAPAAAPDTSKADADKKSAEQAAGDAAEKQRLIRGRLANITNVRGARGLLSNSAKLLRQRLE